MIKKALFMSILLGMLPMICQSAQGKKGATATVDSSLEPRQNLIIEVKAYNGKLKADIRMLVGNATQANFVKTDKKNNISLIVNCLPAVIPGTDKVNIQLQVELTSCPPGKDNLQLQTNISLKLGEETTVVDYGDSRVTVKVSRAKSK